jgi:tetratricopeptide (TPR) repeat protein
MTQALDGPSTSSPARKRGWRKALWLLLVLLVLGIVGVYAWHWISARQERSKGLELAETGRFERAAPLLRKAYQRDPEDREVVRALALGYRERNDSQVEEFLNRWVQLQPDDPEPFLQRMRYSYDRLLYDKALADAERVLELDPENLEALRKVASSAHGLGQFARCEQVCRKYTKRDPTELSIRRLLASSLRNQERLPEALEVLQQLHRQAPDDPGTLVGLGHLYDELGQPEKAIPLLRQAIHDPKRLRSARYFLALALKHAGHDEEARQFMAEANQIQNAEVLVSESSYYPGHLGLKVKAAQACVELGNYPKALELLAGVLRIDPNHANAHRLLADIYDHQGRPDLAARHRRLADSQLQTGAHP